MLELLAVGPRHSPLLASLMQVAAALPIYNPNALPLYREPLPGQRKRKTAETEAVEDRLKHKPALGSKAPGVGAGGKLGSTGGTLLTQYVLKTHGLLKNPQDEDIRASILRHAGAWHCVGRSCIENAVRSEAVAVSPVLFLLAQTKKMSFLASLRHTKLPSPTRSLRPRRRRRRRKRRPSSDSRPDQGAAPLLSVKLQGVTTLRCSSGKREANTDVSDISVER